MTRPDQVASIGVERDGERILFVALQFLLDLQHWTQTDPRVTLKILRMMIEIRRDPFRGIGKPEPLKRDLRGSWSRRISDEHRLVYRPSGNGVEFTKARDHYP